MRRLAHGLFTLCSAVSLVLFAAITVLWVWSYWRQHIVYGKTGPTPMI